MSDKPGRDFSSFCFRRYYAETNQGPCDNCGQPIVPDKRAADFHDWQATPYVLAHLPGPGWQVVKLCLPCARQLQVSVEP